VEEPPTDRLRSDRRNQPRRSIIPNLESSLAYSKEDVTHCCTDRIWHLIPQGSAQPTLYAFEGLLDPSLVGGPYDKAQSTLNEIFK
jgi:hypothetical protein